MAESEQSTIPVTKQRSSSEDSEDSSRGRGGSMAERLFEELSISENATNTTETLDTHKIEEALRPRVSKITQEQVEERVENQEKRLAYVSGFVQVVH